MKERIGIYGGTFDPIHNGHLRVAEEVREKLGLKKIYFVPAHIQPLKNDSESAAAKHRLKMTELAIKGNPFFEVENCEIERGGSSYTVETLEYLRGKNPDAGLFFLMGTDAWQSVAFWKNFARLFELAEIVVMTRAGYQGFQPYEMLPTEILEKIKYDGEKYVHSSGGGIRFVHVSTLEISGTAVRELAAKGRSIKYLAPPEVEDYIIREGLYKT